jgi:two-component system sensor histidine kinase YesM
MKPFNKLIILKKIKLRHQLIILIFTSILMTILLEFFYYVQTYKLSQRKANDYMHSTINQVDEKLNSTGKMMEQMSFGLSYNKYVQDYLSERDPYTKYLLSLDVSDAIAFTTMGGGESANLSIIDSKGYPLTKASTGAIYPVIDSLIKKYSIDDPNQTKDILITEIIKSPTDDNYYFAHIRTIYDSTYGAERKNKTGQCIIITSADYIQKIVDAVTLESSSNLLILDSFNNVVAANNKRLIGYKANQDIMDILSSKDTTQIKKIYNKKSLIQYKYIENLDWKVVGIIPVKNISDDLVVIRNYGFIIGFVSIIILLIIGVILFNSITSPISNIIKFMNNIGKANTDNRLKLSENNEVSKLSHHINKMLDDIDEMTKSIVSAQVCVYEAKIGKKQAQLSALQSQINPHFLYNTLDCMQGYGYLYNCSEIVNITSSLSKILRYSIKGGEIVYVKDEVECIKNYLNIISIRFNNKHKFDLHIDEGLINLRTIKFIIQPIVENAIYHGLEPKETPGTLSIKGQLVSNNIIYLQIKDDGVGMTSEDLEKVNFNLKNSTYNSVITSSTNKSIGLININNRIKNYFGNDYGIAISSVENEGTCITIEIPVIEDR